MSLRASISTSLLGFVRSFANALGCELVIEGSDHSLNATFEVPNTTSRAWDSNLYRRGQLYIKGYANPVKLAVNYKQELENPDTVEIEESDINPEDNAHTELISSPRYREYMRQDLISQLLNPRAQWRLVVYAVIALGILMAINVVISLNAAGAF